MWLSPAPSPLRLGSATGSPGLVLSHPGPIEAQKVQPETPNIQDMPGSSRAMPILSRVHFTGPWFSHSTGSCSRTLPGRPFFVSSMCRVGKGRRFCTRISEHTKARLQLGWPVWDACCLQLAGLAGVRACTAAVSSINVLPRTQDSALRTSRQDREMTGGFLFLVCKQPETNEDTLYNTHRRTTRDKETT